MSGNMKRGLIAAGVLAVSGVANAALPAGVEAAMTSAGADGLLIVAGLAAAGAAVFLIGKVLKKFGILL